MQFLEYQIILGVISTVIGLAGYVPYFNDILKRRIKPHAFSWLIWGLLQLIVFFLSTSKGGGAGEWVIGAQATLNLVIFAISMRRGDVKITLIDKASLSLALLGIVLWMATTNPLWGVVIASVVDVIAIVPTIRKAYAKPYEDSMSIFVLGAVAFAVSIFALSSISLVTVLYPTVLICANAVLIAVMLKRRSEVKR